MFVVSTTFIFVVGNEGQSVLKGSTGENLGTAYITNWKMLGARADFHSLYKQLGKRINGIRSNFVKD